MALAGHNDPTKLRAVSKNAIFAFPKSRLNGAMCADPGIERLLQQSCWVMSCRKLHFTLNTKKTLGWYEDK